MTTATEPVTEEVVAEAAPQETVAEEKSTFNPETLSEEIKGYVKQREDEVSKRYADYERHKSAAQEWEGVKNDPRFLEWSKSLNAPAKPQPFEVADDEFVAALSDKNKFLQLVNRAAERLVNEKFGPQIEQTNQKMQFQEKITELQQTVAKYPDFKELDKRGLIEPIVRKYPNLSFEDAYFLAKKDTLNEEADRRARGIVAAKKTASIERGGTPPGARTHRANAKNRQEAMEMVMEAARAGRPIPEFDEIGD